MRCLFFLVLWAFSAQSILANPVSTRPNVIVMMVDDLGFSDFGCYGSEIETPHIDQLAEDGMRFTNFHNTAKCHSSRISLLTGLYADQAGYDGSMKRGATIAQVLQPAGYATMMVGKWHLQKEPTDFGFEKYWGHLSGATNFFTGDGTFRLNGEKYDVPETLGGKRFYTTEANIHFAKQFLDEHKKTSPEKPFFLYVAHNTPHYPLHVKKVDYEKYEGRYTAGWEVIREQRLAKQKEIGLLPKEWKPAPRPQNVPAWDKLNDDDKQWDERRMTAFAGMIDNLDQTTGELVSYLKENDLFENTLILICSDNGACPFDRTRGKEKEPWDAESYWCYDTGWSHVGNVPFRLHKQNQHGGGINSPLIAHWPKGIKHPQGTITKRRAHLIDFMPTLAELARALYPEGQKVNGAVAEPLQGISLSPFFKLNESKSPAHQELWFRFENNRALIQKDQNDPSIDWKAVMHRKAKWELYNLTDDGTEMNNLAEEYPERVAAMAKRWREIALDPNQVIDKHLIKTTDKVPTLLLKNGKPERW